MSGVTKLDIAERIAWKLYGMPYIWGGDDPIDGFDCSGMIVEILKSVGILPHTGDWTAHDLWLRFRNTRLSSPSRGALVFYGGGRATHVEFCLSAELSLGASGGGSSTLDEEDAADQNAFIKIRPIARRPDIMGYLNPFSELDQ
jgi:cell wall-associated NlpC family hydrolase